MRRLFSLIPALVAVAGCAKKDAPAADTAQAEVAVAPAPPPALTEANVAGTWKGSSRAAGSDSVIGRWTQVCAAGSCTGTQEGSTTSVVATYTVAGDSSVGVTKPFSPPGFKGARIVDTWVAHINGDSVTGTGTMTLASKPDSVVGRYTFAGSRVR